MFKKSFINFFTTWEKMGEKIGSIFTTKMVNWGKFIISDDLRGKKFNLSNLKKRQGGYNH